MPAVANVLDDYERCGDLDEEEYSVSPSGLWCAVLERHVLHETVKLGLLPLRSAEDPIATSPFIREGRRLSAAQLAAARATVDERAIADAVDLALQARSILVRWGEDVAEGAPRVIRDVERGQLAQSKFLTRTSDVLRALFSYEGGPWPESEREHWEGRARLDALRDCYEDFVSYRFAADRGLAIPLEHPVLGGVQFGALENPFAAVLAICATGVVPIRFDVSGVELGILRDA